MTRYAAIDAGTNSTKMTIAEVGADGVPVTLATDFESTRLGLDMHAGMLSAAGIERTSAALCRFVKLAEQYNVKQMRAVATQFAREAQNFGDLQAAVKEQCKLKLEVISGEEEARLAYRAISIDFPHSDAARLVFNIGGGSTEVIYGHRQPQRMISVPTGASSLTRHFPETAERISEEHLWHISRYVEDFISAHVDFIAQARGAVLIGSGGTMTNLGGVDNVQRGGLPGKVHLYRLPTVRLRRLVLRLAAMEQRQRGRVVGLSPDRVGIIVGGAIIALAIATLVHATEVIVAMRGLRDGMLAEMIDES